MKVETHSSLVTTKSGLTPDDHEFSSLNGRNPVRFSQLTKSCRFLSRWRLGCSLQGVSKEDLYLGPAVENLMVLQGNARKYSCRSPKFCLILEQQPANCGLARAFVNKVLLGCVLSFTLCYGCIWMSTGRVEYLPQQPEVSEAYRVNVWPSEADFVSAWP